ncbi:hypothetical protein [Methanoculleus bovis]
MIQTVVADDNRKIVVVLDIGVFEKIEEPLEGCGLTRYMGRTRKKNLSRSTSHGSAMRR